MKILAKIFSYIFHPTFIPFAVAFVIIKLLPQTVDVKVSNLWLAQMFSNTIVFPVALVFFMWRLQMIKSMQLQTNIERLGPLIGTMVFYCWNYYVMHKNSDVPIALKAFLLGTFLSICMLFFTTIFTKMSMHAAGVGGLNAILFYLSIYTTALPAYWFIISLLVTAIVLASRFILKEHTKAELVTGYAIGIISQLGALLFYMR